MPNGKGRYITGLVMCRRNLLGAQEAITGVLGSAKEITENLAALQAHSQTTRVAGLERDLAVATKRLELEKIAVTPEEIGKTAGFR